MPDPLQICDDAAGKHYWYEPCADGDTCACGRFYLHRGVGLPRVVAVVMERPNSVEDELATAKRTLTAIRRALEEA